MPTTSHRFVNSTHRTEPLFSGRPFSPLSTYQAGSEKAENILFSERLKPEHFDEMLSDRDIRGTEEARDGIGPVRPKFRRDEEIIASTEEARDGISPAMPKFRRDEEIRDTTEEAKDDIGPVRPMN